LFLTAAHGSDEPNFYWLTLAGDDGGAQSAGPAPVAGEPAVTWHRSGSGIVISLGSPASGRLTADVYDLSGRSVRTLGTTVTGSGPCELYWDATSRTGTRVAPGVYFVSVRSADATHRVKVVLQ
jgi:flagellar hook assembly protein FlgD